MASKISVGGGTLQPYPTGRVNSTYNVVFAYSPQINTFNDTDCNFGAGNNCLIPAITTYNFTMNEFTDNTFAVQANEATRQKQAGKPIYLKIESDGIPSSKIFSVKKCDFVNKETRYTLFDPSRGFCENDIVEFSFSYGDGFVEMSHRLFLFRHGYEGEYSLECEIGVCDLYDLQSDCNQWLNAC